MIGHQNGLIRLAVLETMKIDAQYQLKLELNEQVTSAVYNPNGTNFAIGTSQGSIFFGSLKSDAQGKAKITVGKIEGLSK